ncbi:MAG: TIGR01620 family protein, partial [Halocynthiibacter sp.]
MKSEKTGPVLIEVDAGAAVETPESAPPVPENLPQGQAMKTLVNVGAARPSVLGRLLIWIVAAFLTFVVSLWFWDFVAALMQRNTVLGYG